jgi:hypothetical protein
MAPTSLLMARLRLTLIGRVPHMCPDVEEAICDLVQKLTFDCGPVPRGSCPTSRCENGCNSQWESEARCMLR